MKKIFTTMTFRICLIISGLILYPTNSWAVFGAVDKAYNGAEIQTPDNQTMTSGETYLFEWVGRPAPGATVVTLFSLFDQSSPWSEITFETFGGGANGSSERFQTQYISDGGNQHVKLHSSPNIFDGGFHTFGIVYRPSGGGTSALIEWYIDGEKIREVNGGDANNLDNTMRVHAAVWKVRVGGWGSYGSTGLVDRVAAGVKQITRSVRSGNRWNKEEQWDFDNNSSLAPWRLSEWTFSHFHGDYVPENAIVDNGTLQLVLSRQGFSNSACTLTNGAHYALENANSERFLDVRDKGTANGSKLQQYGKDASGRGQRTFAAVDQGSGYWSFKNIGSGRYLDVEGGTSAVNNSRLLQLWSTNGNSSNRQFDLVDGQNGGCELRPRHTINAGQTKCIGVRGGSKNDGADVLQFNCNSNADQEWNFIPQ